MWLWQPDLEPFMGRREGPRDCTKSWYFYKPNVEPSTLLDFLRDLEEYENRFVRNGLEVVSRGRRLWDKLGERGVNYQNNSVDIPYNKEKELAKRILNRNEDFLRDMNIRIHAQDSGIPGAPNSQSRVDLIGTENSGGKVVLIELKLKHLRRAVIELLEYLRAWHTINPTDELEGIYLFPMNARVESINEEAVRAEVLKRLYGFDLSLVAFNYQGGRFSYQRVVLE